MYPPAGGGYIATKCYTPPEQVEFHLRFIQNMPMDVTVDLNVTSPQYLDGPPSLTPSVVSHDSPASSALSTSRCYILADDSSSESSSTSSGDSLGLSSDGDVFLPESAGETSFLEGFDFAARMESSRRCLIAALPSVDRWMRVCIWTRTNLFLDVVLDVLGGVPGPGVKHLLLGCPVDDDDPFHPRSCLSILNNPRPIFATHLPRIVSMQVIGVPIPFVSAHLIGLRCLCIRDIHLALRQFVPELVASLTSVVHLEELVFGGGIFRFPPGSILAPRFSLPTLEVITILGDEHTENVLTLLLTMDAPLLKKARFYNFSMVDWGTVVLMPGLSTIEDILVDGYAGTPTQAHLFLLALSGLVSAEFICPGDVYVPSMYVGSVEVVDDFTGMKSFIAVPCEIWTDIYHHVLPDAMLDSRAHDVARLRLLAVSRASRTLILSDSSFWSSIHIDTRISVSGLLAAVGRLSDSALIRLKLSFDHLDDEELSSSPADVFSTIDSLLAVVTPFSGRWETFTFSTSYPSIYHHVHSACANLLTPVLRSVTVEYEDDIFDSFVPELGRPSSDPSGQPLRWFQSTLSGPAFVHSHCISMHWTELASRSDLVSLAISDIRHHLDWRGFEDIFAQSPNLTTLRLRNLPAFPLPDTPVLSSFGGLGVKLRTVDFARVYSWL
ncbi:hypothetical protein C8R47DRAFT_1064382 [Mycena vitilis]|nr:hypothetical protein C8R47DRAFT_1064382 [Mycena vitilis]